MTAAPRTTQKGLWFYVPNQILGMNFEGCGKPYVLAVYLCLCKHADAVRSISWPSEALIAAETGMSERTVVQAIKALREARLIVIKRLKYYNKTRNKYLLTDPTEWLRAPNAFGSLHYVPRNKSYKNKKKIPLDELRVARQSLIQKFTIKT